MTGPDVPGELLCLAAAACWAVAVVWFRRPIHDHGARLVNLGKCAIASVLLAATAAVLGQLGRLASLDGRDLALVGLSGLVGMAVGDTALFSAVRRLGAHRTLLLQTLSPVFAALAAAAFLGERWTPLQMTGGLVVLGGVGLVVAPAREDRRNPDASGRPLSDQGTGILFAVLAALGQALGVVIAKPALGEVPVLLATLVRLTAASVGLAVILAVMGRTRAIRDMVASPESLVAIGRPALLGTYLAVLLMMAGIARAPASVAALLLSTSPIFSLFVEARVDGRPVERTGLVGTLLAVGGVALLSMG